MGSILAVKLWVGTNMSGHETSLLGGEALLSKALLRWFQSKSVAKNT